MGEPESCAGVRQDLRRPCPHLTFSVGALSNREAIAPINGISLEDPQAEREKNSPSSCCRCAEFASFGATVLVFGAGIVHHECEVDVKARGDFYLRVLLAWQNPCVLFREAGCGCGKARD